MSTPPFKVVALYPYTSDIEDDLTFDINQEIQVDVIEDDEWYSGSYVAADGSRHSGMFPKNFVKILEEKPAPAIPIPPRPTASKAESAPVTEDSAETFKESPVTETEKHENETTVAGTHAMASDPKAKNSFLGKISTFNSEASAPINPDLKPKEQSYVNKPFLASPQSSYVPPSFGKPTVKKESPKEVPPPINSSSIEREEEPPASPEDEGPKLSLKERIALLQQRQQEQAEREAEAERRREEKKEAKRKKKAEGHLTSTSTGNSLEHSAAQIPGALTSNATGGSQLSTSTSGTTEAVHGRRASIPHTTEETYEETAPLGSELTGNSLSFVPETSEEVVNVESKTGTNLTKEESEAENDDDDEEEEEEEEEQRNEEDQDNENDSEDDDEDEEDDEESRKRALRERMAKLSGGVGMFGMMGMASPFAAAPSSKNTKKVSKADTSASDEKSHEAHQTPQIPLPAAPQIPLPATPQKPVTVEEPGINAVPHVPDVPARSVIPADDEEGSDETPAISNARGTSTDSEAVRQSTDITDDEEDTVNEERPIPAVPPPIPEVSPSDARAEIQDHAVEKSDVADNEVFSDDDEFEDTKTHLPGAPINAGLEVNTTGYDADEDTDAPPPLPEFPAGGVPPASQDRNVPPIPPSQGAPAVPLTYSIPPPVPSVPPLPVGTAPPSSAAPGAPPVPTIPPSQSRSQTFNDENSSNHHTDTITPLRRSSTQRDKGAPPPPPAATPPSKSAAKKSLDVSRRSIDTVQRSNTFDHEVGKSSVEFSPDSDWWINSEIPPSLASEIGKNATFEVDTNVIEKRGGRKVIYRDYYVLYHDLSQQVIEVNYSADDPHNTVSFRQFEKSAPTPRKDKLDKASLEYGSNVLSVAESLGTASVGVNRLVPYVFDKLSKRFPILPAIGNKGYGALIFKFNSADDNVKYDEIRPGDILCIKAKFYIHNKLRQKTTIEVGTGEVHTAIIYEYDPAKQKFSVIETDQSGKVSKGRYKLGDFKSGKLRVFRVVGRDYVNWN